MNELLTLVQRAYEDNSFTVKQEIRREIFCSVASIGQREFYLAQSTDLRPEIKFIVEDYLDYEGETLCIYEGTWYRIIRTYRDGLSLELVAQPATAEEVGQWAE